MKTTIALFVILLLASCNSTKQASTSGGSITTASANYLWQSSFPKSFRVSSDFSAAENTNIEAMGNQWESSLSNKIDFFSYGSRITNNNNPVADGIFAIQKSTDWYYTDYPDALAVTQIWGTIYNRGTASAYTVIQEADILMNYEFFKFDDPTITYDYDLRTVMLHEMGHFLGLQHVEKTSDRTQSVMYPSIYYTEIKRIPKSRDIADLASKYNVTLGALSANAIVAEKPALVPMDAGQPVSIVIELKANGDCVHHQDGVEYERHHVKLK